MKSWDRTFFFSKQMFVLFVILFLAIYFRTYSLHGGPFLSFRSSESLAREVVDRGMTEQVQRALAKDLLTLPNPEKARWVNFQVRRLKQEERTSYEDAVRKTKANIDFMRRERLFGKHYLLEADPYHYFFQTERLLETGRISDVSKDGKYLQRFMLAPHGYWEAWSFHPFVGLLTHRLLQGFDSKISLMKSVSFVPIFLTLAIFLAYAGLGRFLEFSCVASAFGMLTIALAPIFIQRSAFGWYDTDPYNYLFPILILTFALSALREKRKFWKGTLTSAFLTGLYALFWSGWPFILILVPGSLMVSVVFLMLFRRPQAFSMAKEGFRFSGVYLSVSGVFLAFFLTPEGLLNSVRLGWSALNQFALAEFDAWPNIFLTVGEAGGITLKKLIFLTGNYVTFAFALLGVFLEGRRSLKAEDPFALFRFLFFMAFSVPILLMSLKTERFSLLFVLPLSVFVSFSVVRILELCEKITPQVKLPGFLKKWQRVRSTVLCLMMIVFLSPMLLFAHVIAGEIRPIMDDVWNDALIKLREKTSDDSIISSWWPPGYFITGVARRRVTVDGGTQHFHQSYWMAKALMADDEREAAGILRMLNVSGDDAFAFLSQAGMKLPEAVELILKIVPLGRDQAFLELPPFLTDEQKNNLLDKTHGTGKIPPSYILIYNDLMEQNLAVSVMAQWDFRKAIAIHEQKGRGSRDMFGVLGNSTPGYIKNLLNVSGTFAKYTPLAPLVKKEGNFLFFGNGVRVDLFEKDAFIVVPSKNLQGRPISLFYLEHEKLTEKTFQGDRVNTSVLFFEDAGTFYCVVADAYLIRSLLFRLYYLGGKGLSLFKPFLSQGNLYEGTFIRVFELDREKLSP